MVAAASVVVAVGTAAGMLTALGGEDPGGAGAGHPRVTHSVRLDALPVSPSPSVSAVSSRSASPSVSPSPSPDRKSVV